MNGDDKRRKYLSQGAPMAKFIAQYFDSERYRQRVVDNKDDLSADSEYIFWRFIDNALLLDESSPHAKKIVLEGFYAGLAVGIGAQNTSEIAKEVRSEIGRIGGKRRSEKLAVAIADGWHRHARFLALQIRSEKPSMAQKGLVVEIGDRWKEEGFKPGFDSLLAFIRTEERIGGIPGRKKV